MTLRSNPYGGVPAGQMNVIQGTPFLANLTTLASGNTQNSLILPSDMVLVSTADATNKGITLPDPSKYGGAFCDSFMVLNGQSGQTINIYPPVGGNIDGSGVNTAVTCAQGTTITFYLQSWTATSSIWIADGGS